MIADPTAFQLWRVPRWMACMVALALVGIAPAAPLRKYAHSVGMSQQGFDTVNSNDAQAAFRVLNTAIGRKYGYDLSPDIHVYDSLEELAAGVRSGKVTTLICSTWELLTMGLATDVDIKFSAVGGTSAIHRWLLLVRRDSPYASLADLRGRRVSVLNNGVASLGIPWLETSLAEAQLPAPPTYFSSYETTLKPSAAILPVFFGKADACLVTETAFQVMSELNPEVGRQLRAIATSESLLNSIICFNRLGWEEMSIRADVERAMENLHREPSGRQLLSLFKCDLLLPYQPSQMAPVEDLFRRYRSQPALSTP